MPKRTAKTSDSIPVTLTIAGSDCSSGAGLQADLKTFGALGTYGLTVVTCVVSEVPGKVSQIQECRLEIIADQLRILLGAFPVAAIKTGMLHSKEVITVVADTILRLPASRRPKLVVDPVMVATSGDPLIQDDAIAAYETLLFPLADVITPNLDEAAVLLGRKIRSVEQLKSAADALRSRFSSAVLLKGGHLRGKTAVDVLRDEKGFAEFSAPFITGVNTHGTGCTYSAAIAAGLARGRPLRKAVADAKKYVTAAISSAFRWRHAGHRVDALNHLRRG